jgi:DHA2 family methylenomycin A resistance protein-like MFS transporter
VFGVSAIAFFVIESRTAHAAIPLGLFRSNRFIAATSTGFVMNLAYFGLCFILTLYFQQIRGATPVMTGLMFIPMTAFTMVVNVLAGRLIAKYGTRIPLTVGQTVEALDFCGFLFIGPGTPIGITLTALVPIGFGAGLTSPPMTTTLLQAVAIEHAGAASGVLGVVRQVGGVLGVATFGALVAVNFNMGMRLSLIIAIVSLLITAMLSFNFVRPVP